MALCESGRLVVWGRNDQVMLPLRGRRPPPPPPPPPVLKGGQKGGGAPTKNPPRMTPNKM